MIVLLSQTKLPDSSNPLSDIVGAVHWSQNDKVVQEILNEVDSHRLTFIAMIYENLGYDKEQAEIRAARFYYTMQGISVVNVQKEQASIEQIFETLL